MDKNPYQPSVGHRGVGGATRVASLVIELLFWVLACLAPMMLFGLWCWQPRDIVFHDIYIVIDGDPRPFAPRALVLVLVGTSLVSPVVAVALRCRRMRTQ